MIEHIYLSYDNVNIASTMLSDCQLLIYASIRPNTVDDVHAILSYICSITYIEHYLFMNINIANNIDI